MGDKGRWGDTGDGAIPGPQLAGRGGNSVGLERVPMRVGDQQPRNVGDDFTPVITALAPFSSLFPSARHQCRERRRAQRAIAIRSKA